MEPVWEDNKSVATDHGRSASGAKRTQGVGLKEKMGDDACEAPPGDNVVEIVDRQSKSGKGNRPKGRKGKKQASATLGVIPHSEQGGEVGGAAVLEDKQDNDIEPAELHTTYKEHEGVPAKFDERAVVSSGEHLPEKEVSVHARDQGTESEEEVEWEAGDIDVSQKEKETTNPDIDDDDTDV